MRYCKWVSKYIAILSRQGVELGPPAVSSLSISVSEQAISMKNKYRKSVYTGRAGSPEKLEMKLQSHFSSIHLSHCYKLYYNHIL